MVVKWPTSNRVCFIVHLLLLGPTLSCITCRGTYYDSQWRNQSGLCSTNNQGISTKCHKGSFCASLTTSKGLFRRCVKNEEVKDLLKFSTDGMIDKDFEESTMNQCNYYVSTKYILILYYII